MATWIARPRQRQADRGEAFLDFMAFPRLMPHPADRYGLLVGERVPLPTEGRP